MREETAFRCRWKRTADGYSLWVPGFPFTKIVAADLESGAEKISELLLANDVATFSSIELSPRPPVAERLRRYSIPEIYKIGGDDACYCGTVDSMKLFNGRLCSRCANMSGDRNEERLVVDCTVQGDGGFSYDKGRSFSLFSAEFLDQLTGQERASLHFREIQCRGRRQFFELIGPKGITAVDVPKFQQSGWYCRACGGRTVGYGVNDFLVGGFVSRESLPTQLPSVFTISNEESINLAVTAQRWDELRDLRRSRGILSHLVGVASRDEIGISPVPEIIEAQQSSLDRTRTANQLAATHDWERLVKNSPPPQEWFDGHDPKPF